VGEIYFDLWLPDIRQLELEPLFSFGGVYLWNRELVLEQAIHSESWINYVMKKLPEGYVDDSWILFQVRELPGVISRSHCKPFEESICDFIEQELPVYERWVFVVDIVDERRRPARADEWSLARFLRKCFAENRLVPVVVYK
jgi:hypothetical protein